MKEITEFAMKSYFLITEKLLPRIPFKPYKKISGADLRLIFEDHKDILEGYLKEEKQIFSFPEENTVIIHTQENLISKIILVLVKKGIFITDIEVEKPTLEDVFLQIARKEEMSFKRIFQFFHQNFLLLEIDWK